MFSFRCLGKVKTGAAEWDWTTDPHLTKMVLYHWATAALLRYKKAGAQCHDLLDLARSNNNLYPLNPCKAIDMKKIQKEKQKQSLAKALQQNIKKRKSQQKQREIKPAEVTKLS